MVEHYCTIHKTVFFKKGAMKNYAHPCVENGEKKWCNEPEQKPEPTPQVPAPPPVEPKGEKTPDIWDEKDKRTRKSIERQTSLNAAVEVAKLKKPEEVTAEKIIATARVFEAYLEGKEGHLVEEVK